MARELKKMPSSRMKQRAGQRLKAARKALGLSQPEFYLPLGISKTRGNNWERGVAFPSPIFQISLYERHGVTSDWIMLEIPHGLRHDLGDRILSEFAKILKEDSC